MTFNLKTALVYVLISTLAIPSFAIASFAIDRSQGSASRLIRNLNTAARTTDKNSRIELTMLALDEFLRDETSWAQKKDELTVELRRRNYTEFQISQVGELGGRLDQIVQNTFFSQEQKTKEIQNLFSSLSDIMLPATGSLGTPCKVAFWSFYGVGIALLLASMENHALFYPSMAIGVGGSLLVWSSNDKCFD